MNTPNTPSRGRNRRDVSRLYLPSHQEPARTPTNSRPASPVPSPRVMIYKGTRTTKASIVGVLSGMAVALGLTTMEKISPDTFAKAANLRPDLFNLDEKLTFVSRDEEDAAGFQVEAEERQTPADISAIVSNIHDAMTTQELTATIANIGTDVSPDQRSTLHELAGNRLAQISEEAANKKAADLNGLIQGLLPTATALELTTSVAAIRSSLVDDLPNQLHRQGVTVNLNTRLHTLAAEKEVYLLGQLSLVNTRDGLTQLEAEIRDLAALFDDTALFNPADLNPALASARARINTGGGNPEIGAADRQKRQFVLSIDGVTRSNPEWEKALSDLFEAVNSFSDSNQYFRNNHLEFLQQRIIDRIALLTAQAAAAALAASEEAGQRALEKYNTALDALDPAHREAIRELTGRVTHPNLHNRPTASQRDAVITAAGLADDHTVTLTLRQLIR